MSDVSNEQSDLLKRNIILSLNDMQQQATLFSFNDILQIKAPPGSGKTKIIISRLLYLLIACRVPATDIIVTTFGKKASLEIKERLASALLELQLDDDFKNNIVSQLKVGTFHGLCLAILKQFGHLVGVSRVEILSDSEQEQILKKAIKKVPDNLYDYYKYRQNKINLMTPNNSQQKKKNKSKNKNKADLGNEKDDLDVNIEVEETVLASVEINDKHWSFDVNLIRKHISKLKTQGLTTETYTKTGGDRLDQALLYFYNFYETECNRIMKLDFDDLLLKTYLLLKQNKEVIPNSKHILVDEFQDTSFLQLQLVLLWSSKQNTGITVVGDPNQCIYAFRDASPSNFKDMIKLCGSQVHIIPLNQNYRSSQKIIDCCQYVLNSTHKDEDEPLCGQFDSDYGPVYASFKTFTAEAQYIANEITYLKSLPNNAVNFSDVAILARTKRQIHTIEKKLLAYRIPYQIIDNNGFLQRKEVVHFMNLLKLVLHFYSDDQLIMLDKRLWLLESLAYMENVGIGKTSLSNLSRFFEANSGKDPLNLVLSSPQLENIIVNSKGRAYLINFVKKFLKSSFQFLEKLDGSKEGITSFLEYIYKKSGLQLMFILVEDDEESLEDSNKETLSNKETKIKYDTRHFSIESLKELILSFHDKDSDTATTRFDKNFLSKFISSIELFSVEGEELEEKEDKVTICTVHKSKGLEWPVVFVPGCSEDYIPCVFMDDMEADEGSGNEDEPSKSTISFEKYKPSNVSYEEKLAEERRIFYVALSRAKHLLYMTSIERSEEDCNNKIRPMIRSRFIDENLIAKLKKYPHLMTDVKIIKQFYNAIGKELKSDEPEFSMMQLVKDYKQFLKKGYKEFVWMGNEVFNINAISLNKNKLSQNSAFYGTNFMSAKDHIDLGLSDKGIQNSDLPKKKSKRTVKMTPNPKLDIVNMLSKKNLKQNKSLPQHALVPEPLPESQCVPKQAELFTTAGNSKDKCSPILSTQIQRSPPKKKQMAPKNNKQILKSPQKDKQLAPKNSANKSPLKPANLLPEEDNADDISLSKMLTLDKLQVKKDYDSDQILNDSGHQKKASASKRKITLDEMFKSQRLKKIKTNIVHEEQDIIVLSD